MQHIVQLRTSVMRRHETKQHRPSPVSSHAATFEEERTGGEKTVLR